MLLFSCSDESRKYHIGVSQCSNDIWRDKQNAELRMSAYFHDDVELHFATAYDSDERQVQQIDSLVDSGIDLLIVAPNQVSTISPAIDRAYDKGIPVIVFERKTNSNKYTAYMGADNYEMGHIMGDYIASRLHGRGKVVEIKGLEGSSPAIERHNGFTEALRRHEGIEVVATLQGDWTEPTAYHMVSEWRKAHPDQHVDLVFGMNDRSAMGARKAFSETDSTLPLFCGIDGLPGENGGIRQVLDSLLDASYIYPTHGDQLMQLAIDILDGKPYEKETLLMSAIVTHDNARVLLMESDEVLRQSDRLEQLHEKASGYLQQLANQRTLTLLAIGFIIMLLLLLTGYYMYQRQKARLNAEREQMARDQLDFYTQVSHELRTPLTLIEGPLAQLAKTDDVHTASPEAANLFAIVRRNTRQLTLLVNKMLDMQVGGKVGDMPMEQIDEMTAAQPVEVTAACDLSEEAPTVLIIDDNADIRAYLRTVLKGKYQLFEAEDGQKGLEVARAEVPDIIISDVMMPVMNGLQLCQQVKGDTITSHIPVVLLTARALSKHQIEGYDSGADAYITKPFASDLLIARIDNLLRNRHLLKDIWQERPANSSTPDTTATPSVAADNKEDVFITRFKKVVEEHLDNSDIGVEDLGSALGLSRVQLYRKIKALTGYSPVDLLRKARLAKAHQLLLSTDYAVSEIAYKVGFTSPSYFTKCFKDEYGKVPGEARN